MVFIYNIIVYYRVWRKVYKEVLFTVQDERALKLNKDLIIRLKLYPIVLIICYALVATKRVYE